MTRASKQVGNVSPTTRAGQRLMADLGAAFAKLDEDKPPLASFALLDPMTVRALTNLVRQGVILAEKEASNA